MAKHKIKSLSESHREALILFRRTTSFMLVFSVIMVVLMIFLSGVQFQSSSCQDRADELVHDNILKPSLRFDDIVETISGVLLNYNAQLAETERGTESESTTMEWLDTGDTVMKSNGFRLFRRTKGNAYTFELRAMFDKLCDAYPTVSMEVMPNVDYEKASYNIRAVVFNNGTRKFVFQSNLNTKEKTRISSFAQVQNVFPGFNQISSEKGTVSVLKTYQYSTEGSYDVYGDNSPLDITIHIEQWSIEGGNSSMWRVLLSSSNLFAEENIEGLQKTLRKEFERVDMLCGGACDNLLDGFLR